MHYSHSAFVCKHTHARVYMWEGRQGWERERESYNDVKTGKVENHDGISDGSKLLLLMSLCRKVLVTSVSSEKTMQFKHSACSFRWSPGQMIWTNKCTFTTRGPVQICVGDFGVQSKLCNASKALAVQLVTRTTDLKQQIHFHCKRDWSFHHQNSKSEKFVENYICLHKTECIHSS